MLTRLVAMRKVLEAVLLDAIDDAASAAELSGTQMIERSPQPFEGAVTLPRRPVIYRPKLRL